jgi:DNA-directed RNA polymerase I, II, and III subunit RPABC3
MQIDIVTHVYPMSIGDKFNMVMSPTLNLDGTADTGYYTQVMQQTKFLSLLDLGIVTIL